MRKVALLLILFYQKAISPFLGCHCKFYPTCSHYASMAINKHGVIVGISKSIVRILKCNPFTKNKIDFP